jgi:hypothetical protein
MNEDIEHWINNSPEPTVNMVEKCDMDFLYFSSITNLYKKDTLVVMTVEQLKNLLTNSIE